MTSTKQSPFKFGGSLPGLDDTAAEAPAVAASSPGDRACSVPEPLLATAEKPVAKTEPEANPFDEAMKKDLRQGAKQQSTAPTPSPEPSCSPTEPVLSSDAGAASAVPVSGQRGQPEAKRCAVPGCGIVLSWNQVAFCGPHFIQIPPLIASSVRRLAVAPYGEHTPQFKGAVDSALRAIERVRRNYELKKGRPGRNHFSEEKI